MFQCLSNVAKDEPSWCPVPLTNAKYTEDSNTSDGGHLLEIFAKTELKLTQ